MQGGCTPFAEIFGFDISKTQIADKRKALRNCVHPETGKHILDCALQVNKPKIYPLFENETIHTI